MVDQADYNMSGHVASTIKRRIMTTEGEYKNANLSMHSQASLFAGTTMRCQIIQGDLSLKQWHVALFAC